MTNATKRALAASLRKLLLEKPLSKITISEISDGAEVNRQTFYYHFNDIMDLLRYASRIEGEMIVKELSFGYDFESDFARLLTLFKESSPVVMNLYRYLDRASAEALLDEVTHGFVAFYAKKAAIGIELTSEDIKDVSIFYGHAIKGVIHDYVESSFNGNIQDIAHKTASLMAGSFRNSLINLANERLSR